MNRQAHHWRRLTAAATVLASLAVLMGARGCQSTAEPGQPALTVLLVEYKGPEAESSADRLRRELSAQGLEDVFIVSGADYASVCVGRYKSWKDAEADAMLKRVRVIRDARGQFPFAGVMLVPVPEQRPKDPWPLEESDGQFTLHIASWQAPGRMAAAQAYAEQLRSRGYEAYVYQGPRLSMVTLGAFGLGIFERPSMVGRPGVKPKITDPKVLDLIKKFPRMRLEGQETPPEAHVPTQLVKVPGKDPLAGSMADLPKALYRVSISLVDTKTGLATGRLRAAGVAQGKPQVPTLVGVLVRQLLKPVEQGKNLRVGVVGVLATDAGAKEAGVDAVAQQALVAGLQTAGVGKIRLFSLAGTRQMLDAVGHRADDVLSDPRRIKGFEALDFVAVGTVTSFTR